MDTLFILALLGGCTSIIFTMISAIKRNGKAKWWLISIVVCFTIMCLTSGDSNSAGDKAKSSGTAEKTTKTASVTKNNTTKTNNAMAEDDSNAEESSTIAGYRLYEDDGFKMQLPTSWNVMSSVIEYQGVGNPYSLDSKKVPISETYNIYMSEGITDNAYFKTSIGIIPRKHFEEYEKTLLTDAYKSVSFKNADYAYLRKEMNKDNLLEPSTYEIIAVRGDVCYWISGCYEGYDRHGVAEAPFESVKSGCVKFFKDIDVIVSSFELTDEPVDFATITEDYQPEMYLSE